MLHELTKGGIISSDNELSSLQKNDNTSILIDFSYELFGSFCKTRIIKPGNIIIIFSNAKFYMQSYEGFISLKYYHPTNGNNEVKLYKLNYGN